MTALYDQEEKLFKMWYRTGPLVYTGAGCWMVTPAIQRTPLRPMECTGRNQSSVPWNWPDGKTTMSC